jgi:hypothetical protein
MHEHEHPLFTATVLRYVSSSAASSFPPTLSLLTTLQIPTLSASAIAILPSPTSSSSFFNGVSLYLTYLDLSGRLLRRSIPISPPTLDSSNEPPASPSSAGASVPFFPSLRDKLGGVGVNAKGSVSSTHLHLPTLSDMQALNPFRALAARSNEALPLTGSDNQPRRDGTGAIGDGHEGNGTEGGVDSSVTVVGQLVAPGLVAVGASLVAPAPLAHSNRVGMSRVSKGTATVRGVVWTDTDLTVFEADLDDPVRLTTASVPMVGVESVEWLQDENEHRADEVAGGEMHGVEQESDEDENDGAHEDPSEVGPETIGIKAKVKMPRQMMSALALKTTGGTDIWNVSSGGSIR